MSNSNNKEQEKGFCCIEFSKERTQGMLEYRTNPDDGKVGYFFQCDCDAGEWYQESEIITYCPFCGMPIDVMELKRKHSVIR
jgi:hypothetical protein